MQGTLWVSGDCTRRRRFIPACAGNARSLKILAIRPAVHPRVCRERRSVVRGENRISGSSPRVQGTRRPRGIVPRRHRFIPACAGNANRTADTSRGGPVHPRVCRERDRLVDNIVQDGGSSPRVQGTPPPLGRCPVCRRFIPACAGNANNPARYPMGSAVHPRVCRERRLP